MRELGDISNHQYKISWESTCILIDHETPEIRVIREAYFTKITESVWTNRN